jgi:(2Fe-2S) ferredoxin
MPYYRSHVLVCVDPQCLKKGAHKVMDALQDELVVQGLIDEVQVLETSRIGGCASGPEMMVYPEGIHYAGLSEMMFLTWYRRHFLKGRVVERFRLPVKQFVDEELGPPKAKEVRVVLRNCGVIDPENIEDYIAEDGYMALARYWRDDPEEVIDEVKASGLRGRGGAGFPSRAKWQFARSSPGEPKYLICNADEGDPGAFMNRRVLEGDPHSVLEGMIIAAYASAPARATFTAGPNIRWQSRPSTSPSSRRASSAAGREYPGQRLLVRPGSAHGRRRVRLR